MIESKLKVEALQPSCSSPSKENGGKREAQIKEEK
jgi:hypothetical protein